MAKILLDYFFPITSIDPTPQASTAFLKQVCVVVKPKTGQEGNVGQIFECINMTQVAARTDNTECQQLFNAGMSKVFLLLSDDLDIAAGLETEAGEFYTVLVSSDFDDGDLVLAQAQGTVTITDFADLVSGTDDTLAVAGVTFTAQTGAATLGTATFQADASNNATAASLVAQINAHATAGALVVASAVGAVVTIKAKEAGPAGNDIAVAYTDNDTNVGLTLAGLIGGKLSGGGGLLVGTFKGVTGVASDDAAVCEAQAALTNRCAFFKDVANGSKNLFYAFGKLLSNAANWLNQQYIAMPFSDGVDELGAANSYFDDKVSFVISDSEFADRLGLFACGGKAITAPYIKRNLEIDLQSAALTYISGNQPAYTKRQAALIEDELQKVMNGYISRQLIEAGVVEVLLIQDNFVANAEMNIAEPKAFWRIVGEMRQTL